MTERDKPRPGIPQIPQVFQHITTALQSSSERSHKTYVWNSLNLMKCWCLLHVPEPHSELQVPAKHWDLSRAPHVGEAGAITDEMYTKQIQTRPQRPSSAILLGTRHHVPPSRRPKSALARSGPQTFAAQEELLQQSLGDRPPYSWLCGNVHGTGHMLGAIVPYPGPSAMMQEHSTLQLYHVPPRQPCRAPFCPQRTPGATTTTLLRSTLNVQVLDRVTELPIPGSTVLVVDARSYVNDKTTANVGSTATRNTKADANGCVRCTVLANHR
jgi:hypothetical protein